MFVWSFNSLFSGVGVDGSVGSWLYACSGSTRQADQAKVLARFTSQKNPFNDYNTGLKNVRVKMSKCSNYVVSKYVALSRFHYFCSCFIKVELRIPFDLEIFNLLKRSIFYHLAVWLLKAGWIELSGHRCLN